MARNTEGIRKPVCENVLKRIANETKNVEKYCLYIESGHFSSGYPETNFSTSSLTDGVELGESIISSHKKKVKVMLGTLINNLGENDAKANRGQGYSVSSDLPGPLNDILNQSKIYKSEKYVLFNERNAKNRFANFLYKNKAHVSGVGISIQSDDNLESYYHKDLQGKSVLVAKGITGKLSVKCAGIMAQHYVDAFLELKKRFDNSELYIILDWSEMSDYTKVTNGSEIAVKMIRKHYNYADVKILNVFYGDDSGEMYRIKLFETSEV